ncbi:MAG TPA: hypothetical protein VGG34_13680 [Opitutaceae bacterium]|jgi:hypothetical protein
MSLRAGALLLALPLAAAGELAATSPFGAAGAGPRENAAGPRLELRGIMPTDAGMRYWIFDASRHRGAWAAVLEPAAGFEITAADPAGGRVVIVEDGRPMTLVLCEGRVSPATPEGNAPMRSIAFVPASRRQPGEPRAPRAAE